MTRDQKDRYFASRRRLQSAAVILLLIPLGLLCRYAPLGQPYVIVKYGGSFLWAATVYWCIAFVAARQRPLRIAIVAAFITALVEFIKRIESSGLDRFRATFAGKTLLGRHFSWVDIAVYWFAIFCAWWIDYRAIYERPASKE